MKFIQCLALLIFVSLYSLAQKNYFLYIQTENKQPFSVRMDGKVFSSSDMGYVIVPRLFGGDYPVTIDFPKNVYPSQRFDLSINHLDLGFILKNLNSDGWVLQNLQTNQLISAKKTGAEENDSLKKDIDDFTKTLSQITNTQVTEEKNTFTENIRSQENPLAVDSVRLPDVLVQQKINSDTSSAKETARLSDTAILSSVDGLNTEDTKISLIFSSNDTSGRSLIYSVSQKGATDTVVLFIPAEKQQTIDLSVTDTIREVIVADEFSADKVSVASADIDKNIKSVKCDKIAEEKDFLQLRKKMASQEKEKEMLMQAERAFQSKCFSTQQVRNLSGMFLEEDKKLGFLIMCRTKLTDPENFGSLISLLTEEANIIKFKEVIQ